MKEINYSSGYLIGKCIYLADAGYYISPKGRKVRKAEFQCPLCLNTFIARLDDVKNMKTVSCGCHKSTTVRKRKTVHGLRYHPLYSTWLNMKSRCYNPKNQDYHNYGGRGITVCDEWLKDFKSFYDHVTILPHYGEPGMTMDRENNDEGYFPGNIRWADAITQRHNQRKLKTIVV